jgi:hypothetical protein
MKSATRIKNNIQYTRLTEESDYLEDIEYNWNYTLMHWINDVVNRDNSCNNIDEQKTARLFSTNNNHDDTTPKIPPSYLMKANNERNTVQKMAYNHNNGNNSENKKQAIRGRLKGSLQCHFCKLMFSYHKERKKHEQTWHFSNVKSM